MEKAHSRINWENYPSIATPLNEVNLNKMDAALNEVDNRVLGLDTAKLDKSTANTMVKDISFAESTGIFTITLLNGTKKTIDTKLEKIATNFSYDYQTQKLKLTLIDGTVQQIDLSSLISQLEFIDSDTIDITVDSSGKVSAIVKNGSITEEKLQPNFLSDVKVEVAKAKSSSDSAYENATTARESAGEAERFRNEAEQFRNEAYSATPEGYAGLVDTVHENTVAINTIVEKAELNIKETAMGENIHLIDSAEGKAVEFALYGKATQDGTPTPENPVDIEVAGSNGSVEVKSTGKNIMVLDQSLNTDSQSFTYSSNTQELISATVNRVSKFIATFKAILKKGETYTISINASRSLAINIYPDKIWGNGVGSFVVKDNKTFTFDGESGEYIIGIYADSSSTIGEVISLSNLQLEKGSVATEYEQYKETTATIPTTDFAGVKVDSNGNYTDSNGQQWIANEIVKYADGSGEKIQRVGKAVFDGSEDETWYIDGQGRWVSKSLVEAGKTLAAGELANALCDRYQVKTGAQTYERNEGISVSDVTAIIYESNYSASDKATWTSYLAENPTTLYYELAEPIRTPLTAEEIAEIEKLSTFYPVTNISNDFDCGMKVKYIADAKNYIDNRLALIEQAMLNSI